MCSRTLLNLFSDSFISSRRLAVYTVFPTALLIISSVVMVSLSNFWRFLNSRLIHPITVRLWNIGRQISDSVFGRHSV